MDDRMKKHVSEFVRELAQQQQEELNAAGTFVELEDLTAEIGDEVAQQLAKRELERRAETCASEGEHPCPDCGRACPVEADREPLILQGARGEIEYGEPRCHCPRCRRDFFPSGGPFGPSAPGERDAGRLGKDRVGGGDPRRWRRV